MKAWQIDKFGQEKLRLVELPIPKPRAGKSHRGPGGGPGG